MLFVTCFYDLSKRDTHIKRRTPQWYLENGAKTLDAPVDLLIFTEPEFKEIIIEKRLTTNGKNKTIVVDFPFEQLKWYSKKEELQKFYDQGLLVNANREKDTVNYIILMRGKFDLIYEAKKYLKEGNWTHLCWIDFGVSYVANDFNLITSFEKSSKIKILCLRPTFNEHMTLDFFKYIQGTRGGGIIQVPIDLVDVLVSFFNEVSEKLHSKERIPLEDGILTYLSVVKPELFELYYGDYSEIINNYNNDYHRGNFYIIRLAIVSCIGHPESREFKDLQILLKNTMKIRSLGPGEDKFINDFIALK